MPVQHQLVNIDEISKFLLVADTKHPVDIRAGKIGLVRSYKLLVDLLQ
jgi:hypothetical protein